MSRVVIPTGRSYNAYHLLKLVSTYGEDVLENSVHQHVRDLFPDFFVIPFKTDVQSAVPPGATKRPDLAIIDRKFKTWGVIETEVVSHSLQHVLDQVNVFVNGRYNSLPIARYIADKLKKHCRKQIPLARIAKLIAEEQPKVLIVADELKEEWRAPLALAGAELCSFELYKNTKGLHLFRTSGKYPIVSVREAHVRRTAASANLFEVTSAFDFKKVSKNRVTIVYREILTEWELIIDAGRKFLRFAGAGNPLIGTDAYVVFADNRERYYFRLN